MEIFKFAGAFVVGIGQIIWFLTTAAFRRGG